jgi:GNAT superfamily N-acetyltransferase
MGEIADGDPTPASVLEERAASGRLYVTFDDAGSVAGFLIWSPKDGMAYIEEVSVDPDHTGHRLAARMIDRLEQDVRGAHAALTLATFRDVPWNAPYYAKLGFAEVPHESLGPDHDVVWRQQAEHGIDMTKRLFMILKVPV